MKKEHKTQGGARKGAGRPKVKGGVRRMWTVPPDIDAAVQTRGTKWLWKSVRFAIAFEKLQENQ